MHEKEIAHLHQKLREQETKLRLYEKLLKGMGDILFSVSEEGTIELVDHTEGSWFGYTPEDVLAHHFLDYIHPDDLERVARDFEGNKSGDVLRSEFRLRRKAGDYTWVRNICQPRIADGEIASVVGVMTEITQERERAQTLAESEERFRLAFETSPDALAFIHPETCEYLHINESFTKILGYHPDEVLGHSGEFGICTGDQVRGHIKRLLAADEAVDNIEVELRTKSGEPRTGLLSARLITLNGQPTVLTIARDITERKNVQREREQLLSALDQVPDGIVITGTDFKIQYANAALMEITGYSREDLIGHPPPLVERSGHGDEYFSMIRSHLRRGNKWHGRFSSVRRNGEPYMLEIHINPIFDEAGVISHFIAVNRDVTEEVEREKQLLQSQKMEAIGTLAGGIAHDFNNILFPIMGYTEISLEEPSLTPRLRSSLERILDAALRARDLVKQILAFSRKGEVALKPVSLTPVIKEALQLLRASIPSSIEITTNLQPTGKVMADLTQVHQVLINLGTNAWHAVKGTLGGITISLTERTVDTPPDGHAEGRYVVLSVHDEGCGIPHEARAKIFEPYFTTKDPGEGTGLGLAVVDGIIKTHNGFISIESQVGTGSLFQVHFPLLPEERTLHLTHDTGSFPRGKGKVLLVDDDDLIVTMLSMTLEDLGYKVDDHTSSVAALNSFNAAPHSYDLVLTDMTMPTMSGEALTEAIKKLRPELPVIIMSGYSELMDQKRARMVGASAFLMKPIKKSVIAKTVKSVLNAPAAAALDIPPPYDE